jgi:hypothetical protein
MRVIGFITQPAVIKRVPDHLRKPENWFDFLHAECERLDFAFRSRGEG